MVIGEADGHVESKDPSPVISRNAAAGSSPGNADACSPAQTSHIRVHRKNASQRSL
jgi:hypothetical protein